MIDHVHFLEQRPKLGAIAYVSACEMNIRSKRLRIARGKIIQPAHLMPLASKLVGKRRAEESRGSGDKKVHR
jgi:hypothetical protein